MAYYFDDSQAIAQEANGDISVTLKRISSQFMKKNPPKPLTARPYYNSGIRRNKDYRYVADFNRIFPDAKDFSYVFMRGIYFSGADGSIQFTLIPDSPGKIWMNGNLVFATDIFAERYVRKPITISIPVKKGRNTLIIRTTKTRAGFGMEFGTWLGKLDYRFSHGTEGLTEAEGIDYTAPMAESPADFAQNPEKYESAFIRPRQWTETEKAKGNFGRIFGIPPAFGRTGAAAVTAFSAPRGEYTLSCTADCTFSVFAGKKQILSGEAGTSSAKIQLNGRKTVFALRTECPENAASWNAEITLTDSDGKQVLPESIFFSKETPETRKNHPWAYIGPFKPEESFAAPLGSLSTSEYSGYKLAGDSPDLRWYRLDEPDLWVRLYNENPLFGHWNYPLGVTLYGLIEEARHYDKGEDPAAAKKLFGYIQEHVSQSVASFDYAQFDKRTFGGATSVHHLLTSIDSLDDCGSFASLMLEVSKDLDIGDYYPIAKYVGDYIVFEQNRLEDGAFWRKDMMHHFHNGTMWADDLYMSVPFLCRYAKLTCNAAILDDVCNQFKGFKKRLYMKDNGLMAHVFDFNRGMNTAVPWGRGNGWTIFSLTELLQVLPEDHPDRPELMQFYLDLCAAYLKVQDESGMWHQVLNMPSSYPETSCTAMFICAFSRGIRNGWLTGDTSAYREACKKAWAGIERTSVDTKGNVYGVCRGSEFAFNPIYYAEHLLPRLNDTHGIGIVLLAGVELLKITK